MKIIIQILIYCTVFGQLHAQQKISGKHLSGKENSTWQFFEESEHISASELTKNKTLLGLGTKDELKSVSDKANKTGSHHYRYQQMYNGVPIEWAVCVIHEKNSRVTHTNSSLIHGLDLSTTPTLNEELALQIVLQHTNATLYAWENEVYEQMVKQTKRDPAATFYPSGELVIIDPQLTQQATNYRLAYKFNIYALQPLSHQAVYIDAHSGEILKTVEKIHSCTDVPATGETNYSGTVNFTACHNGSDYILKNNIGGGMQVFDARGQTDLPFYDSDGHFDMNPAAVDIHWATEKFYDYLLNTFDRNSVDDNGAPLLSKLVNGNNAYWDGECMFYGVGDSINFTSWTSLDMVAHEITHALTHYTSNLIYYGESGALNESFSDIFGEVIERYIYGSNDWIIGADFTLTTNGLRSMANPNDPTMDTQQPDTYLGTYYYTGSADYGGVHTNSGIQNHWFYLLSEGGIGTNDNGHTYDIAGIGMEKAVAIAYANLTTLAPNANFDDARSGSIAVAQILQSEGILIASDVEQVTAAWCAVDVGSECLIPSCRAIDSLALVALYNSTNGANWINTWDLSQPMDTWYGVTLDDSGCVASIDLHSNQLTGNIPLEIGNLSDLTSLNLHENQLNDSIPSELGNLSNLTYLQLSSNQLIGIIPPELSNLSNLTGLYLRFNQLSGSIPPELGNLSNLIYLSLYENQLNGSIPSELGNLTNLISLNLHSNELSSSIPSELGNLTNLTYLYLRSNQLSGSIPPELGNLTNLTSLKLQSNLLSGCYDSNLMSLCNQLQSQSISNGNNLDASWEDFCNTGAGACNIPCRQRDSLALVALYNSTNGANWTNPWDLNQSMDNWSDVILNGDGCVTHLYLGDKQLVGSIPPEIGNLISLNLLYLSLNELVGSIPPEIGNLSNLTHLSLSDNDLSGSIPPEIGNLINLTYLSLSNNDLSGSIPPEIGNLDNLTILKLTNNRLSGNIPLEIGNLSNLTELHLYYNQLNGSIPPEIGNLSSLIRLSLYWNQLTGSIPPEVGNLGNLTHLLLHHNQLTGSIPPEIGNLSNLTDLSLLDNQLSGSIPPEIGNLINLNILRLQDNQLSGCYDENLSNLCSQLGSTESINAHISNGNNLDVSWEDFCNTGAGACNIPCRQRDSLALVALYNSTNGTDWDSTWNLNQSMDTWYGVTLNGDGCVTCLDLDGDANCNYIADEGNNLVGNIPPQLGDLTHLNYLKLSHNKLMNAIPPELGKLSSLGWLYLDDNQLSGSIPPEIGDLSNLRVLFLNNNELNGNIPPELGNLENLTYLYLSGNQLSGNIPPELGNLNNLIQLHMGGNQLSDNIPVELGNLSNLTDLGLDANSLSGNIPAELGSLSNLGALYLQNNNQLSGTIPAELGNLSSLIILSLSGNQLSGTIPPELGNLSSLKYLYLIANNLTGTIPVEIGGLINLEVFDIRGNNLSGVIPSSFSNLTQLRSLTFSSNQFEGNILDIIVNFQNLESFHASRNQFSGSIPQSINNLTQLREMSLYENQFTGTLPAELGDLDSLNMLTLGENQFEGCYDENLTGLCTQLLEYNNNTYISDGNNFDAPWEDFCMNQAGVCRPVLSGDCNADGVVNQDDLLYWGSAVGNTGTPRPNATTTWTPQDCPEWNSSIGGVNSKHQDANGDGIIDEDDLAVLEQNYGAFYRDFSYSHDSSSMAYILEHVSNEDSIDGFRYITYEVYIHPNNSINTHGISLSIEFKDRPKIDNISIDTTGSVLQPTHYIQRYNSSDDGYNHTIEFALTRTDRSSRSINGPVATLVVADRDLKTGNPTNVITNSGLTMSATGVVTSVGGSTSHAGHQGGNPTLPVFLTTNDVYCQADGTAEVIVSEGKPPYTYLWSTGATSSKINNLDIGTYSVTVNDVKGLTNVVEFEIDWAFTPVEVHADDGQICFNFEDTPLSEAVEVSLDNGTTYMQSIRDNTCYPISTGNYPIQIRLTSDTCATFLTEINTCTSTLNIVHIKDDDISVGVSDDESFSSNPVYVYAYDAPGLPLDAMLTNIKLELYFKVLGTSCEQDIEVRITDPLGKITTFQPFTTCDGVGTLYHTFLDVPDVSFVGNLSDWQVEFRDINDNNPSLAEYSVRFARLIYDATFDACNSGTISTVNKNGTLAELSEIYLYPVPATDVLNIEYTSDEEADLFIEIFDVMGRISINKKERVHSGVNILKMNIYDLPQGIYYVRISDTFGRTQVKSFAKVSP